MTPARKSLCVAITSLLLGVGALGVPAYGGNPQIDEETALKEIRHRTEVTLKSISAPTGLFGVKWIWSSAEIKAARPNARLAGPGALGELKEVATFYGRPVTVYYKVGQPDLLSDIFIKYTEGSSLAQYNDTQQKLASDYGVMPAATMDPDGSLSSDKSWPETTWGKAAIIHTLTQSQGGTYAEGVVFVLSFPHK